MSVIFAAFAKSMARALGADTATSVPKPPLQAFCISKLARPLTKVQAALSFVVRLAIGFQLLCLPRCVFLYLPAVVQPLHVSQIQLPHEDPPCGRTFLVLR